MSQGNGASSMTKFCRFCGKVASSLIPPYMPTCVECDGLRNQIAIGILPIFLRSNASTNKSKDIAQDAWIMAEAMLHERFNVMIEPCEEASESSDSSASSSPADATKN